MRRLIFTKLLLILSIVPFTFASAQRHYSNQSSDQQRMNTFIDSLMKKMTLDEKIGQLNLLTSDMAVTGPTVRKNYAEDIRAGKVGAIFNAYTPDFVRKLQDMSVKDTRLHIPLFFGYDVIHGHKTIFPIPLALASSWDTTMIKGTARIAAEEATADGLNWVYSPMVDITRDPRWGRVMEGAGEDPFLGSAVARAMVEGYQGNDLSANNTVMACVKHYALYGAVEAGREYNSTDMSKRRMFDFYLPTYKAAVKAGAASIMTSFNDVNGVPSTANKWLMTDLLRTQWKFDGFVVTDYNAINELVAHGIAADDNQASEEAINAGVDMDMQAEAYIKYLKPLVQEHKVNISTIDTSVRRILEAKWKLGLFADPYKYIDDERAKAEIMSQGKLDTAREAARKTIVLLKNDKQLLPLKKSGTIALIGPLADDQRDMIGSWSAAGDWHKAISLRQGIQNVVGGQVKVLYSKGANLLEDSSLISNLNKNGADIHLDSLSPDVMIQNAVNIAKKADVVVMALGESAAMTGEAASRSKINIPDNQENLLQAIYATGKPIVLMLMNGRPLTLDWENEHISSILESWFLGTEAGNAIADVLFGDYNPSGKLTISFPVDVGQIPVYYAHKNTGRPRDPNQKYTSKYLDVPNKPLYPFGYGLSYTKFNYSDISLSDSIMHPDDDLKVSVTVSNTGDYDGTETVQFYIRDMVGSVTRPVEELRGFKKVFLKKGESKKVTFNLTIDALKFYDKDMKYTYEPGAFKVFVGGNSEDVKEADFRLEK